MAQTASRSRRRRESIAGIRIGSMDTGVRISERRSSSVDSADVLAARDAVGAGRGRRVTRSARDAAVAVRP